MRRTVKEVWKKKDLEIIQYYDHRTFGGERISSATLEEQPAASKGLLSPVIITNAGWVVCEDKDLVVLSNDRAYHTPLHGPPYESLEFSNMIVIVKSTIIQRAKLPLPASFVMPEESFLEVAKRRKKEVRRC